MERKGLKFERRGRAAQDATFITADPGHAPAEDLRRTGIDAQVKGRFLDKEGQTFILRIQAAPEG